MEVLKMGLFGKSKDDNREIKNVKSQVDKLMKAYDNEEMDSATYLQKMMDFTTSNSKKKKK